MDFDNFIIIYTHIYYNFFNLSPILILFFILTVIMSHVFLPLSFIMTSFLACNNPRGGIPNI